MAAQSPSRKPTGGDQENRVYYDAFASRYERQRGKNAPHGYHELLDELESELVRRHGSGKDVLEVGCGTGLVLERIAGFARRASGIDLSEAMLDQARRRGLDVKQASILSLPFPDESFDVVCAFKVLAHVADIRKALSEMTRVTRTNGIILAEFYNQTSLRALIKRWAPRGRVAPGVDEGDVFTRYDTPELVPSYLPAGCRVLSRRGIRIVTPAARVLQWPGIGALFSRAERRLCDTWFSRFGGFFIAVIGKEPCETQAQNTP